MNRSPARTNVKGAFLDGAWYCDCEPRLPAEHFQTKNGGQNHGRWFYTCQKTQPKRCKFFVWDDEAKVREEAAVLNNSRSEAAPKTPSKPIVSARQYTPPDVSPAQQTLQKVSTDPSKSKTLTSPHDDISFDWSASNDEALVEAAQIAAMKPPETPRKTPRTLQFTSPGKRNHSEVFENDSALSMTMSNDDDVFNTPRSSEDFGGLPSPAETPIRGKSHGDILSLHPANSSLATDALSILARTNLSTEVEHELVDLLNKYELRTQGISRGRDITRLALGNKERKIAELEARITSLEAERETSKAIIAHLKRDIVQTTSSKGKKRGS